MRCEIEPEPLSRRALFLITLACEGGLALAAMGLGWLSGIDPRRTLPGGPADLFWGVATALALMIVFGLAYRSRWGPLVALREQVQEMVGMLFGRSRWADLVFAASAAGFGEELFFRGWLQPFLGQFLGTSGGLLAASLLFGLAHPHSRTYVVLATVLGMLFGWLWLATGSLVGPIVAHALYDLAAIAWLRRQACQQDRLDALLASHSEGEEPRD
jgi:membrane protease YdiL (CAAX protease family)